MLVPYIPKIELDYRVGQGFRTRQSYRTSEQQQDLLEPLQHSTGRWSFSHTL